jgi:hypothetical protein
MTYLCVAQCYWINCIDILRETLISDLYVDDTQAKYVNTWTGTSMEYKEEEKQIVYWSGLTLYIFSMAFQILCHFSSKRSMLTSKCFQILT